MFQVNDTFYFGHESYPLRVKTPDQVIFFIKSRIAKFILDNIYDLVNFILFVFIGVAVDILLMRRVRQVLREREAKLSEQMSDLKSKQLKNNNRKAIRRVSNFVVLNSVLNICLKMPIFITTLSDFVFLVSHVSEINKNLDYFIYAVDWFSPIHSMRYFCYLSKACEVFQRFGNFLFHVSLWSNFFFLKGLDNNYKESLKIFIKRA